MILELLSFSPERSKAQPLPTPGQSTVYDPSLRRETPGHPHLGWIAPGSGQPPDDSLEFTRNGPSVLWFLS